MEVHVDLDKPCVCVPFNESEYTENPVDWANVSAATCSEVR